MNGAENLMATLREAGVTVCFANPGTSEIQLVAAIDATDGVRGVLGLFEGVVTGAADGYGRMTDRPAATLLHLGPGLGNGLANLHNARRARTPVINIVGDHATYHVALDAPLTCDVVGVATPMSDWVAVSTSPDDLAQRGADAFSASMEYPGRIATLIAPADHAWGASTRRPAAPAIPDVPQADEAAIEAAAAALSRTPAALFLGGRALREDALEQAGRVAAATGARLLCETFPARLARGAGRVPVERLPYFPEAAADYLKDFKAMVFVGATPPVSFFAYPGTPGRLSPEGADLVALADARTHAYHALRALAERLHAPSAHGKAQAAVAPPVPSGRLDPMAVAAALTALMPENAIVSDESNTAGFAMFPTTAGAPKHDWLALTGGSIGQGLPLAVGAAVACPDRKVIALQADGAAMYTVQALWTMAREQLDVTTVVLNNGRYAVLDIELARLGVTRPGPTALSLLDLTRPDLDWVELSDGLGVPAVRADTAEGFTAALKDAIAGAGPRLVEALIRT